MNIKRAFLAAIAVLMLPGMAMAQSTFPASFTFTPASAADPLLNLELTCAGGTPLQQDINVKKDTTINFAVAGATGSTCAFALTGAPDGWTATDNGNCALITAIDGVSPECVFSILPEPFIFSVDVDWIDSGAAGLPSEGVLTLTCDDVWNGSAVVTIEQTITIMQSGEFDLVGLYAPHPDLMSTMCGAEVVAADSAIEFDDSDCAPQLVVPGDGPDVTCSITATVFFEGIPTLSQYGMAIMVLLMLGVGFVGFRRFV